MGNGGGSGILSHSSTVEKLDAWEKKLFLEVKVSSSLIFNFINSGLTFAFSLNSSKKRQNGRNVLLC